MNFLIKNENYSSDNFNANDYWKNGEKVEFRAIGFYFSLKDLKKIRKEFDRIKEVKEMNYDLINQILTLSF